MFGQRLLGLCFKEGIVITLRNGQASVQIVDLLGKYLCRRPFGQDAACPDIIEVVQILRRVALQFMEINLPEGLDRLALQADIIIIGGVDNGKLALGIEQSALLARTQYVALLVNALHASDGTLAEVMEVLVAGTPLAEAHHLHIADEDFYLVVSLFRY